MSAAVTKIVVADEHFLYLPLYYAEHKKFFGLLPAGAQVKIVRSRKHTDRSAFSMLMDEHSTENRDVDIAVCDPACVLDGAGANAHPVVLAGLLTNSAFWAVNHKANRVQFLEHLATFENIIAFKQGTTSFGIANRIFPSPDQAKRILTVDPNQELNLLVDSGPGAIALSPDIVGIQQLLENKGHMFGIELALADTSEYRDMLVTALLTRRDVLKSKPELIRGLLQAVQLSLVSVRNSAPDVLTYAAERFNHDSHTIQKALVEAHRAEVYPVNIRVLQPTWMKLAEIAAHSVNRSFDEPARQTALRVYQVAVEPYAEWAAEAVRKVEYSMLHPPVPQNEQAWAASVVAVAGPLLPLGALMGAYRLLTSVDLPLAAVGLLVAAALAAGGVARLVRIVPWTLSGLLYWIPLVGCALAGMALADVSTATQLLRDALPMGDDFTLKAWPLWAFIGATLLGVMKHVHTELRRRG